MSLYGKLEQVQNTKELYDNIYNHYTRKIEERLSQGENKEKLEWLLSNVHRTLFPYFTSIGDSYKEYLEHKDHPNFKKPAIQAPQIQYGHFLETNMQVIKALKSVIEDHYEGLEEYGDDYGIYLKYPDAYDAWIEHGEDYSWENFKKMYDEYGHSFWDEDEEY